MASIASREGSTNTDEVSSGEEYTDAELSEQYHAIVLSVQQRLDAIMTKDQGSDDDHTRNEHAIDYHTQRVIDRLKSTLKYWTDDVGLDGYTGEMFATDRAHKPRVLYTMKLLDDDVQKAPPEHSSHQEELEGDEASQEGSKPVQKPVDPTRDALERLTWFAKYEYRVPKTLESPELTRVLVKSCPELTEFVSKGNPTLGHKIMSEYISARLTEANEFSWKLDDADQEEKDRAKSEAGYDREQGRQRMKPFYNIERHHEDMKASLASLANWWDGFESRHSQGTYRPTMADIDNIKVSLVAFDAMSGVYSSHSQWPAICDIRQFLTESFNALKQEKSRRGDRFDQHEWAMSRLKYEMGNLKMDDPMSLSQSASTFYHQPLLNEFVPSESLADIPKDWFERDYHQLVLDGTLTINAKHGMMSQGAMQSYQAPLQTMTDMWTAARASAMEKLGKLKTDEDAGAEDSQFIEGKVDELDNTVERYKECQKAMLESTPREPATGSKRRKSSLVPGSSKRGRH